MPMPLTSEPSEVPLTGSPRGPTILLLAGEASGDQHGAHVARALKDLIPGVRLVGMGGSRMRDEGVDLFAELKELAVMGFAEVLARLPYFLALERRLTDLLARGEIDLMLPIDYPGFNLRLAQTAHRLRIPVVYYIAPQVWAWKPHRAEVLARVADRIAVILPFEVPIFEAVGGRVYDVGHPLLDETPAIASRPVFSAIAGLDPARDILAVFPGSRAQELRRHLSPFLGAADELVSRRPGLQVAVARAPGMERGLLEAELTHRSPDVFRVVEDGAALLHHARVALVKSGTSTLEAALAGVPFVVAYRTHPVSWKIAQRLVRVPHIALANLVAEDRVVPELLQDEAVPSRLADALAPLFDDGPKRAQMLKGLAGVRARLGEPGAADRVAALVAEVLAERADRAALRARRRVQ
jgi:lipid-A-disaccharide synthase